MDREDDGLSMLYVDLHLVHEVTSPQAFAELAARELAVRRPERVVATMDHSTPTLRGGLSAAGMAARLQLETLQDNCRTHGIPLYGLGSDRRGIVHVIGPELGLTRPGMTIVCGDSHTSTHGAFGALAFGIGTSEVAQVLATQCLLARRPRTLAIELEGRPGPGVTAKDLILALIARIGVGGATGHVIEYRGSAVRELDMERRMTLCNMSIEAGARAGMIAPDDTTFDYLFERALGPRDSDWNRALGEWRRLPSDPGARFDRTVTLEVDTIEPMITFGTNPSLAVAITGRVPDPAGVADPAAREPLERALSYMSLAPGEPMLGLPIDVVFIGSCTNGRLCDLRDAAEVLRGRRVHPGTRLLVVPGSATVKRRAEAEGLDRIFVEAGAEWREPGCSMCIAMNGDRVDPGQYVVSTSNRNFEGRQGPGGRTFLASPYTAAASAVCGRIADARRWVCSQGR